ncbi:uncharacterized protein LOC135958454 [Calliphora vicina]|uniref:uncharacterized protein LOC135958454 n=1 Tax=Calliphora vicina TaxID=7373 RepID=UPI00325B78C8
MPIDVTKNSLKTLEKVTNKPKKCCNAESENPQIQLGVDTKEKQNKASTKEYAVGQFQGNAESENVETQVFDNLEKQNEPDTNESPTSKYAGGQFQGYTESGKRDATSSIEAIKETVTRNTNAAESIEVIEQLQTIENVNATESIKPREVKIEELESTDLISGKRDAISSIKATKETVTRNTDATASVEVSEQLQTTDNANLTEPIEPREVKIEELESTELISGKRDAISSIEAIKETVTRKTEAAELIEVIEHFPSNKNAESTAYILETKVKTDQLESNESVIGKADVIASIEATEVKIEQLESIELISEKHDATSSIEATKETVTRNTDATASIEVSEQLQTTDNDNLTESIEPRVVKIEELESTDSILGKRDATSSIKATKKTVTRNADAAESIEVIEHLLSNKNAESTAYIQATKVKTDQLESIETVIGKADAIEVTEVKIDLLDVTSLMDATKETVTRNTDAFPSIKVIRQLQTIHNAKASASIEATKVKIDQLESTELISEKHDATSSIEAPKETVTRNTDATASIELIKQLQTIQNANATESIVPSKMKIEKLESTDLISEKSNAISSIEATKETATRNTDASDSIVVIEHFPLNKNDDTIAYIQATKVKVEQLESTASVIGNPNTIASIKVKTEQLHSTEIVTGNCDATASVEVIEQLQPNENANATASIEPVEVKIEELESTKLILGKPDATSSIEASKETVTENSDASESIKVIEQLQKTENADATVSNEPIKVKIEELQATESVTGITGATATTEATKEKTNQLQYTETVTGNSNANTSIEAIKPLQSTESSEATTSNEPNEVNVKQLTETLTRNDVGLPNNLAEVTQKPKGQLKTETKISQNKVDKGENQGSNLNKKEVFRAPRYLQMTWGEKRRFKEALTSGYTRKEAIQIAKTPNVADVFSDKKQPNEKTEAKLLVDKNKTVKQSDPQTDRSGRKTLGQCLDKSDAKTPNVTEEVFSDKKQPSEKTETKLLVDKNKTVKQSDLQSDRSGSKTLGRCLNKTDAKKTTNVAAVLSDKKPSNEKTGAKVFKDKNRTVELSDPQTDKSGSKTLGECLKKTEVCTGRPFVKKALKNRLRRDQAVEVAMFSYNKQTNHTRTADDVAPLEKKLKLANTNTSSNTSNVNKNRINNLLSRDQDVAKISYDKKDNTKRVGFDEHKVSDITSNVSKTRINVGLTRELEFSCTKKGTTKHVLDDEYEAPSAKKLKPSNSNNSNEKHKNSGTNKNSRLIRGYFPLSRKYSSEKILYIIAAQNKLNTRLWKIIRRKDDVGFIQLILDIDDNSWNQLVKMKGEIFYRFSLLKLMIFKFNKTENFGIPPPPELLPQI